MMSPPTPRQKWLLRSATGLRGAVTAASAGYWGSRIAGSDATVAMPQAPRPAFAVDTAALARALGALPAAVSAGAAEPGAAQRFALMGVIASVTGKGAALISVDGQPPRPLSVGAQVAPGYTLKAVGRREALLVDSASVPAQIKLSLPALDTALDAEQPEAAAAVAAPARPAVIAPAPSGANPPAVPGPSRATRPGEGPPARQDSRYPLQGR